MALNLSQLTDFVTNTLAFYHKAKWLDLSMNRQRHVITSQIFKKNKQVYRGGTKIQEQVQTRNAGTFAPAGAYQEVTAKVVDHMDTVDVPWTSNYVHWTYEVNEDAFQSGPERILRTIDVRVHSMWNDYFDGLEDLLWGTAPGPNASPLQMFGVMDWLQKATSATAEFGFNGGNPPLYPNGIGNLDSTLVENYKNGNFGYKSVSHGDLLRKIAEACDKSYFLPVHDFASLAGAMPDYMIYTTYPVLQEFYKLATASNDNLDMDMGKYYGRALFKGNPIEWVPALTNSDSAVQDVTNPVIGLNWNDFEFAMKSGKDREQLPVIIPESQPSVRRHYYQSWFQFWAKNRRSSWIGNDPSLAV